MTRRLENKVALITGTAQGQGRIAAHVFAEQGAKIIGCDLNPEGNRETARMVRDKGGEMISIEPLDLCRSDEVKELVNLAETTYGRLDILYNNASASRFVLLPEMSEEDWQFTVDNELNLIFYTVKASVPLMIKSGKGSIINISAIAAIAGQPVIGSFAHAATKAGVLGITKSMSYELAPYGIRVNAIVPGMISNPDRKGLDENPKVRELISSKILLRRIGKPEDVVNAALFMASDESSYITGTYLVVDGGWTAW